ncbi:MAG: hypothetical protein N2315_09545, partial [Thermanaerothrix sp.]|nr:hypothetical protein [Thermanaerothrix sp.]
MRRDILEAKGLEDYLKEFLFELISQKVQELLKEEEPELWELKPLEDYLREITNHELEIPKARDKEELINLIYEKVLELLEAKKSELGEEVY